MGLNEALTLTVSIEMAGIVIALEASLLVGIYRKLLLRPGPSRLSPGSSVTRRIRPNLVEVTEDVERHPVLAKGDGVAGGDVSRNSGFFEKVNPFRS